MAKRAKITLPRPVRHCIYCLEPESDDVHISARGICPSCGEARLRQMAIELQTKSGDGYREWLLSRAEEIARAVHAEFVGE